MLDRKKTHNFSSKSHKIQIQNMYGMVVIPGSCKRLITQQNKAPVAPCCLALTFQAEKRCFIRPPFRLVPGSFWVIIIGQRDLRFLVLVMGFVGFMLSLSGNLFSGFWYQCLRCCGVGAQGYFVRGRNQNKDETNGIPIFNNLYTRRLIDLGKSPENM